MLVSACRLSTYRIFKVRFFFRFHLHAGFSSLSFSLPRFFACGLIVVWLACGRSERSWGSGPSSVIMFGRVGHPTVCCSVGLGTSPSSYLLQYAATARLAPSHSIIDTTLGVFYSASCTER
jgi:hypothetical protein